MAVGNNVWSDIIEDFMDYTENAISSEIHRLWSGISLVGGACERRVWAFNGDRVNFPSLYILLVAPPGTGKAIINTVKELWREVKLPMSTANGKGALHVASDSLTRASFIDELAGSTTTRSLKDNPLKPYTYSTLLVAAEEFEVLLPFYDSGFISMLNDLWNAKSVHAEKRRHGPAREVTVDNPQLHILGGAQPSYFVAHFPEQAWETGLARRVIMVYADSVPHKDPFAETPNRSVLKKKLLQRLGYLSEMYQEVRFTPVVKDHIREWHKKGRPPEPTHSKLAYYNNTRLEFVMKLSIISCVSRAGGSDMAIEEYDLNRALKWLLEAERYMPDIFQAMIGRSDTQVREELHRYMMRIWTSAKRPIKTPEIVDFLSMHVPSEKVDKVFRVAETSGLIARAPNAVDSWIPRPNLRLIHGD